MSANITPVYPLTPNTPVGKIVGASANVKSDGTGTAIGTDMILLFTAGANGSLIESVRFSPSASSAATATAATVLRLYLSSQTSGATTNANTTLIAEVAAAAQTADQTTTATFFLEVALNKKIQAGYVILASSHIVNNASTTWSAQAFGADY
jgi:hypothetical protein